jgi:hypothetical protein
MGTFGGNQQMSNVKAQSSNEIQNPNGQKSFWHLVICH